MLFLDTNIVLRYLTRDLPEQAQRCRDLLMRVDAGEVEITTSESVIAEIVYVLSSPRTYALPRTRVRELLEPVLHLRGLKLEHRTTYLRALALYVAHPIDFEDAVSAAHMERLGISDIVSYDHHFDGLPCICRVEP
jgi:uncharacterized protein